MSFINAIIDAQERNLCLERLKAELAETPYFQKTDKALTACIADKGYNWLNWVAVSSLLYVRRHDDAHVPELLEKERGTSLNERL